MVTSTASFRFDAAVVTPEHFVWLPNPQGVVFVWRGQGRRVGHPDSIPQTPGLVVENESFPHFACVALRYAYPVEAGPVDAGSLY